MVFNHERFGVKLVPFSAGDTEAEPHYSLMLLFNHIRVISTEQVELTRGLPGDETREFLRALHESCKRALADLEAAEQQWNG